MDLKTVDHIAQGATSPPVHDPPSPPASTVPNLPRNSGRPTCLSTKVIPMLSTIAIGISATSAPGDDYQGEQN
jgi:hypothetical protein